MHRLVEEKYNYAHILLDSNDNRSIEWIVEFSIRLSHQDQRISLTQEQTPE
jgi:hypothetical protein